jgi:peroxiredoxin
MPLTSADRAFGIIALERKLLTKDGLAAAERDLEGQRAQGGTLALADHLVATGAIEAKQRDDVERIRSKHGRACEGCGKTTFLLPGELASKKPCEHCGGKLRPAAPGGAPPKPAAPAPGAAPETKPEAPALERSRSRPPRAAAGEPAAPGAAPSASPGGEGRDAHARKLRMAGAFGYEPPPPTSPPPPGTAPTADPTSEAPPPAPEPAPAPPPEDDPAPSFSRPTTFEVTGPPIPVVGGVPVSFTYASFADEVKTILSFPVRGPAVAVVSIGAVFGAVAVALGSIAGIFGWFLSLFIIVYYHAYQVKVTNRITAGHDDLPDWPDPGESGGLGWRLFVCDVACFLPAFLLLLAPLFLAGGSSRGAAEAREKGKTTVGDDATELAGATPKAVNNDVSDEEFLDAAESTVRISDYKGKWVVVGLIDKDDAGDTALRRGIATPEVFDLDRLARADKETVVLACMIDPGERRMKALGLVKDEAPRPAVEKEGDDEVPERTKLPRDLNPDPLHKNLGVPPQIKRLKVIRTRDFAMPDRFGGVTLYPTVWVIDPTGRIRKEYESGASDHKLYGVLTDLRKGGSGDAPPRPLPGEEGRGMQLGFSLSLSGMLFTLGLLFGMAYHPMAFLMVVVFTSGAIAFNYPGVIGSILRTHRDYLQVISVLIVASILGKLVSYAVNDVLLLPFPVLVRAIASGVVDWWVFLYTLLVEAYALGRFYVRNQRALGWF